jgi:heterotetrameric sarcosine oxidase gamma subunit
MYRAHLALGARFRDDGGWKVVDAYTRADGEAGRARAAVGLADMSAGGKFGVRGGAVETLLSKVAGAAAPAPGRAARLRVNGADVLGCRLALDELLLLTSGGEAEGVAATLSRAGEAAGCAHLTDLTSALALIDLLGPAAQALLARLSPLDLSPAATPPLAVVAGECAGVRTVFVRLDRLPLPAFRLAVPREYAEFVWTVLADAGQDLGLTPVGMAARALLEA